MEKLSLNHKDMEYLKMAMIKHDQTFKHQVHELHRLYGIQKMLMKDAAKNAPHHAWAFSRAEARPCPGSARPAQEIVNVPKLSEDCTRDSWDDQGDLELTLGPRSYYQKKIKAAEPDFQSESGPSFSSSSTGSSHVKGVTRSKTTRDEFSRQKKLWGQEMPNNVNQIQDRLNSPPWLFQALSLNIT